MALTNAERQKRYRENLKALAAKAKAGPSPRRKPSKHLPEDVAALQAELREARSLLETTRVSAQESANRWQSEAHKTRLLASQVEQLQGQLAQYRDRFGVLRND